MATNLKNRKSIEEIAKDMDYLIMMFGDDKEKLQQLIVAHLVFMGWDRNKATTYAALVEEFAKLGNGKISIWSEE